MFSAFSDGFNYLMTLTFRFLVILLVAILSVNYFPEQLFSDFPYEPYNMEPINYESVTPEWNSDISNNNPEFIQLNNIVGPESIAQASNGLIYTGLADGRIVELDPKNNYQLRQILRFRESPKCLDNIETRATECGRFLQMRFFNDTLFGIEAGSGLYKIDPILRSKKLVGPRPLHARVTLFNSFVFDPVEPNLVYITVSSTRWNLHQIVWSIAELESSGQIVALDIKTGKRVIILDDLYVVNGIDIDEKRDQLIFTETSISKVSTLSLSSVRALFKSHKDGSRVSFNDIKKKVLIAITPGNPDNVIVHGEHAYIALPFVRYNGKQLLDQMAPMANVRKAYGRLSFLIGKALEYVYNTFYRHPLLEVIYHELKTGKINYRLIQSSRSAVIKYNLETGTQQFIGSAYFGFISEAVPDKSGEYLLLGSFRSPFVVKVKV